MSRLFYSTVKKNFFNELQSEFIGHLQQEYLNLIHGDFSLENSYKKKKYSETFTNFMGFDEDREFNSDDFSHLDSRWEKIFNDGFKPFLKLRKML